MMHGFANANVKQTYESCKIFEKLAAFSWKRINQFNKEEEDEEIWKLEEEEKKEHTRGIGILDSGGEN